MKKIILHTALSIVFYNGYCQQINNVNIHWDVVLNNGSIVLHDSNYQTNDGNTLQLETLKFYISNIQLLQNDEVVFASPNSFNLIDISDSSTQHVFLQLTKEINFNKVKFNLGIDSLTNVSGAMGGDLDPTKGMYWTWQSGYINFKMEGICSNCNKPKNKFEFHLGGYQYPLNPLQEIELNTNSKSNINIRLDLNKFVTNINFAKQKNIMSPCAEAVVLSKQLANCFSIK